MKTIFKFTFLTVFFGVLFIVLSNFVIKKTTNELLFDDANKVPFHKVGLVLGTNKQLVSG